MSEDRSFDLSTALFHVTMYRQYARKVGTSANSALIRYYLPRLKLSIALLSRKRGNERLVLTKCLSQQPITGSVTSHVVNLLKSATRLRQFYQVSQC